MPVINFSYSDLCELVGREVPREVIKTRLPMLGADLKSAPDESDELSFEFFPDRPDLYSVEGVARALRAFLGFEPGLKGYATGPSQAEIHVDDSVRDVRPHIWTALVEGNEITDPLIRSMMDLQEKLHVTLGRNRRKVAIGIHDYRTVRPPFTYKAVGLDEVSFFPLQGSRKMTPREILHEHEKGKAYAFVLEGKSRCPMIVDSQGEVLSFPPIINGITTAVTENTRDIFVDCTGTDINAVTYAVNIVTTALAERGGKVKTVTMHQGQKVQKAPDLTPRKMHLDTGYVNGWIGTGLSGAEMASCLRRMGHGASESGTGVEVLVPAYRTDVLHPVDLAEDVAVGHGYENFGVRLPRMATFGVEDPIRAFSSKVRPVLTGLGYFEAVTLTLSNPREQFTAMNLPEDPRATRVLNPVSEDQVLLRTSILPSLMTLLRRNKHRELPQRMFEIGDVVIDSSNRTFVSGVSIHPKAGFTEAKSLVQSVFSALGLELEVHPDESPPFIPGRAAAAMHGSRKVGVFGELAPSTIHAFELGYPVSAFELDLGLLRESVSSRRMKG